MREVVVIAAATLPNRAARTGRLLEEARRLEATGSPADAARARELCWRAVELNDGLARKWANVWGNRNVPYDDRLQTARLGLLAAAQKWDPGFGRPFPVTARWWVRARLTREHQHHEDVSAATEELLRVAGKLEARGLTDQQIGDYLGVSLGRVRSARAAMVASHPASLDAPLSDDGSRTLGDILAAPGDAYPLDDLPRVLSALDMMKERDRFVLTHRFGLDGDARTFDEIGAVLGLSRERVRQIERSALNTLKERIMSGPVTDTRDRLVAHLEQHPGARVRAVASALGVSEKRVHQLAKALGVLAVTTKGRGSPVEMYLPGTAPSRPAPAAPPGGDEAPRRGSAGGAGEGGAADGDPNGGNAAPERVEPEAAPSPGAGPHALTEAESSVPELQECRECGTDLWSRRASPICDGCELYARGVADGASAAAAQHAQTIAEQEAEHAQTAAARSALRDLAEYRGRRIEELEAERQELEETVQQLEAELRVIRSQRVAVDDGLRQELAQIRALVGSEHPTPIAVALEVGAARALRARP